MHAVHLELLIIYVKKIVSEKAEYHWEDLARELGLEDGKIEKCGECCYQVLQKWCEENGE